MTTKTPSEEELNSLYTKLSKVGKPAILSLEPEFCDSYVPLCMRDIIPQPLTCLFDKDYLNLAYPDLLDKCEEVYNSYVLSPEQAERIEEKTRDQA